MKKSKVHSFLPLILLLLCVSIRVNAQNSAGGNGVLDNRQQQIVMISSFTAKGNLEGLKKALNDGLTTGLAINEIKEVLVHLYAYCGFPRSIRGLQTFMAVLDERKAKGITDKVGREATPMKTNMSEYEQGKKALEALTGQPERNPKTGYAAFTPVIDTFLKEHLFADIFGRDVLTYADREIATIAALISLGGVEPMMQSHLGIALHIGLTEAQLQHLLSLVALRVGKKEAAAGRAVLAQVLKSRGN